MAKHQTIRSGGGITSNKLVRPPVKTGAPSNKVNPGGVDQLGQKMAVKTAFEPLYVGKGAQAPLGNAVAASTVCGPGGSRTIMRSGSQAQHGAPVRSDQPQGRDMLSQFGPESRRPSSSKISRSQEP
jgi:hypothetical protein